VFERTDENKTTHWQKSLLKICGCEWSSDSAIS
jgi:hypothetical protein